MQKRDETPPESARPDTRDGSKLIGYGLFSLVFRPPVLLGNCVSTNSEHPDEFVGLITTHEHYQTEIKSTTKRLTDLISRNHQFSDLIVLPVSSSDPDDYLMLSYEQTQKLIQQYHAVRKRAEYEETWKDKSLVQLIYPYAGKPLAQICNKPQTGPGWADFFEGMAHVARFLIALHDQGYVHGDLSPNNLLYQKSVQGNTKFTIVDWNMLTRAEDFLKQGKGRRRVGCWSPEHFSLTTTRLEDYESDRHWLIYAEEMQKYTERLLGFSFSTASSQGRTGIRKYFDPYIREPDPPMFQDMYNDLKILARVEPSVIGKYHDIRYFMDTIAKCVSFLFPNRSEAQKHQYNLFISLYLTQNLPDRRVYLENPDTLLHRLSFVLEACHKAEQKNVPSQKHMPSPVEAEQTLMNLLR